MIDWGICGTIIAGIAFVCTNITDYHVKRLQARIAEYEEKLEKLDNNVTANIIGGDIVDG